MLTAFTAGLILITINELGDKTFCIAAILAAQYSRRYVLIGVVAALAAMTILSVLLGQAVSFLPKHYIHFAEITLFIGFGLKMLYDGLKMKETNGCDPDAVEEAKEAIKEAEISAEKRNNIWTIIAKSFTLTFIAEWGDRTQFATITLAAGNNPIGVTAGAILGHTICAVIAVTVGKLLAGKISERKLTLIGGCLFIFFGILAAVSGE